MNNILLVAIIILSVLVIGLYLSYTAVTERLTLSKMKNTEYEYALNELKKENSALRDGLNLKAKMEKETNEKIDSLHDGDAVANAINGLSKHSGGNG